MSDSDADSDADADASTSDESSRDRSSARDGGGGGGRWRRAASAGVGAALVAFGVRRRSLGGAAAALAGGWLVYRGVTGGGRSGAEAGEEPVRVERTVTVGKPADELAELWRDPETLGRVVGPIADVASSGEGRHRWQVDAPLGRSLSWETELVEEESGELLRWEPVDGAPVFGEGTVRFESAPGDRGTKVTLDVRLDPPGGGAGAAALERLGVVPDALVGQALYRFASLAETGEIPTTERNPSARGKGDLV